MGKLFINVLFKTYFVNRVTFPIAKNVQSIYYIYVQLDNEICNIESKSKMDKIKNHLLFSENPSVKVKLHKITNGNTTRYLSFETNIDEMDVCLNKFISEQLGINLSKVKDCKDSLIVHGCGMDMAFFILYQLYQKIGLSSFDASQKAEKYIFIE